MIHVRYAIEDTMTKLDQARALLQAISPTDINGEPTALYARLDQLGWEWRNDGWYAKVKSK